MVNLGWGDCLNQRLWLGQIASLKTEAYWKLLLNKLKLITQARQIYEFMSRDGTSKLGVYLPDTNGLLRLFCSQLFAPSIAAQFIFKIILYLFLYLRLWYQIEKIWIKVNNWKFIITEITFLLEIFKNSILHVLCIFF